MTHKEMSELFSVMMLAWPNAEMFKGGVAKLGPTIALWSASTADVDAWTGQRAVVRLCNVSKFPPTIAEFKEQVDAVNTEIRQQYDQLFQQIRSAEFFHGTIDAYYHSLPPGSFAQKVISRMGGPGNLVIAHEFKGQKCEMWNIQSLKAACLAVIRGHPALDGVKLPALKPKN